MRKGKIYKNQYGRYQLENDTYYWTSGDAMTIYDTELNQWLDGRVEHGDIDYYWTNDSDTIALGDGINVIIKD